MVQIAALGAMLVASLAAVRGATQTPPAQAPARAPAGNIKNGQALYKKTGCYQCHGNEAQGGAAGPRLGPNPIPFLSLVTYVRTPRGEMPPYTEKVMSDQDLADIYAFLEARPRPPALSSLPLLAR